MGPTPVDVLVSDSTALGRRPVLSARGLEGVGKSIMLVQWHRSSHPLSYDMGPQNLFSVRRPSETTPRSNFPLRRVYTKDPVLIRDTLTPHYGRATASRQYATCENSTPDTLVTSVLDSQDNRPFLTPIPAPYPHRVRRAHFQEQPLLSVIHRGHRITSHGGRGREDCPRQCPGGYKACVVRSSGMASSQTRTLTCCMLDLGLLLETLYTMQKHIARHPTVLE